MSFQEWKRWLLELPWALRWFVVLVLIRPTLDTLYFLKEISPLLSPLYIVGVLTPVLVVASLASKKTSLQRWSFIDVAFALWGWILLLSVLLVVGRFASMGSVEVGLKISLPVFIYAFVRHLIHSKRDLHGVLTTFLYSTVVPFSMALYEQVGGPLGDHVTTRQFQRYGGLYADVVSYAMYTIGALLVVSYFFLAQPRSAPFRTHALRFVVVGACVVVGLISAHHSASYAVAAMILILLVVHGASSRHLPAMMLIVVIGAVGYAVVGGVISERVGVLFQTDLQVLSGEKDTEKAFHGRMTRWKYYLDDWDEYPVVAKLLGVGFGVPSEGRARAMMLTGIHSDYLRILFTTGIVGIMLYLSIYAGILSKLLIMNSADRFLVLGGMAVVLMYSITVIPTLYAPLLYLCLSIYAYAAQVRKEDPPMMERRVARPAPPRRPFPPSERRRRPSPRIPRPARPAR